MEDDLEHAKGKNDTQLQKYLSTHYMTAMGDGATIVKMLISNVLASTLLQSNEASFDTGIDQFIHACDHPLNLWGCPIFKVVIASAHLTSYQ